MKESERDGDGVKYVYYVENIRELTKYAAFAEKYRGKIEEYIDYISKAYAVGTLPQYVVLSNFDMATSVHSKMPLPAYTNETRMVITPEIAVWKEIYLKQIEAYSSNDRVERVRNYYENVIGDAAVLQIIGHELAHQSELFLDDFDDELPDALWFEEGMVEYISRRFFLTEEEFAAEKQVNQYLVELFEEYHKTDSVESFGRSTYDGSCAAIFYEYWRSFLLVDALVSRYGSVEALFAAYHQWNREGKACPLSQWFSKRYISQN